MDNDRLVSYINKKVDELQYDNDIQTLHHTLFEGHKLKPSESNISVLLVNIPCNGFGDIINCKTFSDYLKEWYPNMKTSICTTSVDKFKSLGLNTKDLIELKSITGEESECQSFNKLKFKSKPPVFDIIIVVPMVNDAFNFKHLQKLIPYVTRFNSFSVSEYNGDAGPYAFPTGVGEDHLGLMITSMNIKKHNIIKGPYALAYTAGHENGQGMRTHTNTCILSFIEMIAAKYTHYKKFQLIIPPWFCSDNKESQISLLTSPGLKTRYNNILRKYYGSSYLILKTGIRIKLFDNGDTDRVFILRGDILPRPRPEFISLLKYSVEDILLTGDQSITDGFAYCKKNKKIWYQISPWKKDFIHEVSSAIPNKYLDNFRTSCGTLKSLKVSVENRTLLKNNDFRRKGKKRMDGILKFYSLRNNPVMEILMDSIEHSRYKDTALKKFNKEIELKYK